MRVSQAHSAVPAHAATPSRGKGGDGAVGGQFADWFSDQTSLLDKLAGNSQGKTLPPENPFDGKDANGKSADDSTNNGNTAGGDSNNGNPNGDDNSSGNAPATLKSGLLTATPIMPIRLFGITSPATGKDKKATPDPRTDASATSNVPVPVPLPPNPLPVKSFFEWELGWHNPTAKSGTKDRDKTDQDKTKDTRISSADFRSHTLNDNEIATARLTTPEPGQEKSDSKTPGAKPDDSQKIDLNTQLAQNEDPRAQGLSKPEISKTGGGPSGNQTELAFASRIRESAAAGESQANPVQQGAQAAAAESNPVPAEPIAPSINPKTAAVEEERKSVAVRTEAAGNQQPVAYAYSERNDIKTEAPIAQPVHAPARVEMPPIQTEPKSTMQLKDVTFQVTQSNEKVEVRIVQQAGEVRVAVRAGDNDLVHGLQQNLSDLSGKLQQSGYHADTWRPGLANEAVSSGHDAHKGSDDSGSGQQQSQSQSQSQSGGSRQDRNQNNQNRFTRPRWVEEMESNLTTGKESTGVSYGIGN